MKKEKSFNDLTNKDLKEITKLIAIRSFQKTIFFRNAPSKTTLVEIINFYALIRIAVHHYEFL